MSKAITIKEIAEKAKVSPGTVDRVIHNRGEVAEKTREKILKIIKEGNYEPNIFARNLVLNKSFTIASLLPKHEADSYWSGPYNGIQRAAHDYKMQGIKPIFHLFDEENPVAFELLVQQIINDKPDGILLAPVINTKALWLAETCAEKKIPLVCIDSEITHSNNLAFIGQNAFKSGYLAGKLLDFANHTHSIHLITVKTSTDNNVIMNQRKDGFSAYFKDAKKNVSIFQDDFHLEDENLDDKLESLALKLKAGDKIFVPNSKAYLIAKTLKSLNKGEAVKIIGYDLIKPNIKCLNEGIIDFLINQKPEEQGYMGIQLFYKYLVLKQEIQKSFYMPLEIVTKENVEFII